MASLTHLAAPPAHRQNQCNAPVSFNPSSIARFHSLELGQTSAGVAPSAQPPFLYSSLSTLPRHALLAGVQPSAVAHPFGLAFGHLFSGAIQHQQQQSARTADLKTLEHGSANHSATNSQGSPPQLSFSSSGGDGSDRSCSSSSCPSTALAHSALSHNAPGEGGLQQQRGAAEKPKKQLVRDAAYWERRRKNNDAAKRSRDSRRKKEDEVAVKAVILEQENLRLRFEVERLRTEIERHRIVAAAVTDSKQLQLLAGPPTSIAQLTVAQLLHDGLS